MNLAIDGLSYFARAIEEVQKSRITHICVKDESTDVVITIKRNQELESIGDENGQI